MLSIPFGTTNTYSCIAAEVARRTGRKHMSAQAVGAGSGATRSLSSCRATAWSAPTGVCAVTQAESTGRNGSWRWRASTCLACQRRQPLTTSVEHENEETDRSPDQTLEHPGDRPDGELQTIC